MSLIGIAETASVLKIGKETLYRIIDEKNIKTLKIGRKIGFDNEQTKILKEAVTEYKTNQPFKKPQVRKEDYSKFQLYTLNAACKQLRIGRKRLFEHIEKLGIKPSLHGSAKIITAKEFNKIRESLEEEVLLLRRSFDELEEAKSKLDLEKEDVQISNPVVRKAIETLKSRNVDNPQQSFNLPKEDDKKDQKLQNNLVAKITELTDERNALSQTLTERTEILEKKRSEVKKLLSEVEFLRKEYKNLRSYKEETMEVIQSLKKAFSFFSK